MNPPEDLRLDRDHFEISTLAAPDDSLPYWLSRTPQERLQAVESLRRIFHGADYDAQGLQRVLELAQLERR